MSNSANSKSTRIIIVGGTKGGVGKSMIARTLIEYLKAKGNEVVAIDSDRELMDILGLYESELIGFSEDFRRKMEPDKILMTVMKRQPDYVVVNLPGNTYETVHEWLQSKDFSRQAQPGQPQLIYFFVTDGCYASIHQFAKSIREQAGMLPFVLIRNEGRLMSSPDWEYLENCREFRALPKRLFQVADFPLIPTPIMFKVDELKLSFQRVVQLTQSEIDAKKNSKKKAEVEEAEDLQGLLFSQGWVKSFINKYTEVFDSLFGELDSLIKLEPALVAELVSDLNKLQEEEEQETDETESSTPEAEIQEPISVH